MSRFAPQEGKENLQSLVGKVFVVTGGANGIGRALIIRLHALGSSVVFGDFDAEAGKALVSNLQASQSASAEHIERVIFQSMDVCSYADNVSLFKRALERFGRVDHAISVAGITEQGNIFSPELNLETVEEPPSMLTFDTNLRAVLYFARIASVYLRQSRTDGEDKSLTLFSSIAGITESPGLFEYGAAKHGVIGLMRALRPYAPEKLGIRVNALCPWMTATQMVAGIEESWYKAKLPVNQPDDVAKVIVDIVQSKSRNGGAFYVEGGRAWEVDRAMFSIAQDTWMGRERRIEWERGQEVLGIGDGWTRKQK